MKNLFILLSIAIFTFYSCDNAPAKDKEHSIVTAQENKLEVIDFYGTHRCITCEAIEANTQYTLETFFKDELASGKITFKLINVDEKENYDMAEKFEATGTALFFNVIVDHKETIIDLTDFAFMKGKDKEAFSEDLKLKIENELVKL